MGTNKLKSKRDKKSRKVANINFEKDSRVFGNLGVITFLELIN